MVMKQFRLVPFPLALLLGFLLTGCDQGSQEKPAQVLGVAPSKESGELSAELARKWSQSCALCHVTGVGGAPRIGNAGEWAPRLSQGKEVLLQHTLEGFNNMPPLGYCMSCETSDFSMLIDFMAGTSE